MISLPAELLLQIFRRDPSLYSASRMTTKWIREAIRSDFTRVECHVPIRRCEVVNYLEVEAPAMFGILSHHQTIKIMIVGAFTDYSCRGVFSTYSEYPFIWENQGPMDICSDLRCGSYYDLFTTYKVLRDRDVFKDQKVHAKTLVIQDLDQLVREVLRETENFIENSDDDSDVSVCFVRLKGMINYLYAHIYILNVSTIVKIDEEVIGLKDYNKLCMPWRTSHDKTKRCHIKTVRIYKAMIETLFTRLLERFEEFS